MKMNKKGFTLIEMLVVIAIIAILVAIVVPTVTSATEKAKEAKDAANIRAAVAEVTVAGLSGDTANYTKTVTLTQTGPFDKNADLTSIAGKPIGDFANKTSVTATYDPATSVVTITTTPAT